MKKKRIVKLEPQTVELFAEVLSKLRPPPPLTVSQWADRYRVLSAESSAEPGRWHTEKAPYQRAIMDAIGDPHVRSVVVMSAAQIGKTDAFILNPLGYYMDYGILRYPAHGDCPGAGSKTCCRTDGNTGNQFGIFQLWRKSAQEIYAGLDVARWKPERGHRR